MAKNELQLSLPKNKNALRIKHLPALQDERLKLDPVPLACMVDTVAVMTGVSRMQLWRVDALDIAKMFNYSMKLFGQINLSARPPAEIMVGGIQFIFLDPEKAPAGWHMDCAELSDKPKQESKSRMEKEPVLMACLCYIPKGSYYGQIDQHDNLVYPLRSRQQLFVDEFPLETFIQLNAFFLTKYQRLISVFMVRSRTAQKTEKALKTLSNGWKRLTRWRKSTRFPGTRLPK